PIHIGAGRLAHLGSMVPEDVSSIAVISNPTIYEIYGKQVEMALEQAGQEVHVVLIPDGEEHKNWDTLNTIFDELLGGGFDCHSLIVALGGGVGGDMAGFAAASVMRGLRVIQLLTTRLAQLDSSEAGKTDIKHPRG